MRAPGRSEEVRQLGFVLTPGLRIGVAPSNSALRSPTGGGLLRSRTTLPSGTALYGLYLDLDVDAGGEVEALERLHGLAGGLDDVDQPLVDPHLEMLAAVLVLVRRADHAV